MTALKIISFGNVIFVALLADVTSWTIDLPEIRRHLFEKNAMEKKGYKDFVNREQPFYSNINGNSMHNSDVYDDYENLKYANEFGYHTHMEKKVAGIVEEGSLYLEGLRRAIESYTNLLENCTTNNFTLIPIGIIANTTWRPQIEITPALPTNGTTANVTIIGNNTLAGGIANHTTCQAVTRVSEHLRRLAELAMEVTRRLQDLAYAEDYQKDVGKEENELILKLAWLLDRLAHLTGYHPDHKAFIPDLSLTTTPPPLITPPVPLPALDTPEDVKNSLMNCLKQNSSEPATVRCAYPLPIPPSMQMVFDMVEEAGKRASGSPDENNRVSLTTTASTVATENTIAVEPTAESSSLELLIAADDRPLMMRILRQHKETPLLQRSDLTAFKSVKKRSITENPSMKLMKYYVKHQAWAYSNPTPNNIIDEKSQILRNYDEKNYMTAVKSIQKRSLFKKSQIMSLPENPSQDISKYLKNKPGVNYNKDQTQADLIKKQLEKMRSAKPVAAKQRLQKLRILKKRAVHYQQMSLPRTTEDPTQDISYYVKNKPGTSLNANLAQAIQARLGLEQDFQTGNIETVRRYGANYNPLIPAPFYFGILKSIADS